MKKQNIKSKAKNKKSEVKKIVKTKEIKKVQYEPKNIENKWIKIWDKQKTYKTKIYLKKKKMHVMDMFPYPSGEGLHVGHVKNFGASDTYTRFKRMQGFNVLHAQGYDAFGLPAEQFAIKMKTNPKIQTKKNTDNFRKQMEMVGFSYDWDREINTTDPEFYKWTQWIFKQLYKKGLCYESFEPINWCPSCKTGLANEDLEDGKCERCSSVVEKKPIRQWVIKITEYAEKLLAGLDDVNWKENIKEMQRNWIGKSTGSEIDFKIIFKTEKYKNAEPGVIPVFTTRPDTLFGATYMVLAPEHTWVKMALEKHSGIFENETEVKKICRRS
jgi:leucyl-tRNA synthetase